MNQLPVISVVRKEAGAVIILFALLLVALFAFVALTIDTTLITSSQSHLKIAADAAVLGALEEYGTQLSAPIPASPFDALTAARLKAQNSLGNNFDFNPGKFLQKQTTNTQNALGTDCNRATPGNGCLRPIIWYPPVPVGSPECPAVPPISPSNPYWRPPGCGCEQSCECGEGCANDPLVNDTAGNGLKIIYRTDQNSPLKALFGAVIGLMNGTAIQEVGLEVISTALLTPRNAIFLLDLSDSMVSLARPNGFYPASFYDTASPPPPTPYTSACFKRFYAYPIDPPGICNQNTIASKGPRTPYGPPNPLPHSNVTDPRNNFFNCNDDASGQYQCLPNLVDADFEDFTPRKDSFYINKDVDPEPLTSALDAVHQAMTSFQAQRVPNDRLGIIGFDDERINSRILALNKPDPLRIQPPLLSDPEFAAFEQATRVVGPGKYLPTDSERYSKYLFPRYFDTNGVGGKVGSDLPRFFKLARDMIKHAPNYRQSQNFVVMFSDGMANCLATGDPTIDPITNPRCKSDVGHFNLALPLLKTELEGYVQDKIAAHFLLLGAKSQPHRLAWRNAAGDGCATAEEIESTKEAGTNLPVVNAEGVFNANGTPLVNQIYPWIKATGGLWAPIMDSFGVNPAGACPLINQAAFKAACSGLPLNLTLLNSLTGSGATVTDRFAIGGGGVWPQPSAYWDDRGRILCDPQNRTTAQQVTDFMKILLGKPPFVLVKPN